MEKLNYQSGYEKYLYTGIQGFIMNQNHRILSKNTPKCLIKINKITLIDNG